MKVLQIWQNVYNKTVRDALKNQSYPSQLLAKPLQLSEAPVYNRAGQTLFNLVSSNFSQLSFRAFR